MVGLVRHCNGSRRTAPWWHRPSRLNGRPRRCGAGSGQTNAVGVRCCSRCAAFDPCRCNVARPAGPHHRAANRRCRTGAHPSASGVPAAGPASPDRGPRTPNRSAGRCRARMPSRSTACGTFFDKVPDLVEFDHRGAACHRLGLGAVTLRMIAHPAQHGLRRDADVLGDRVHRQAQAVKLDRMPLQRRRLATRFRAGELSTAAFARRSPA